MRNCMCGAKPETADEWRRVVKGKPGPKYDLGPHETGQWVNCSDGCGAGTPMTDDISHAEAMWDAMQMVGEKYKEQNNA